MQIQQQEQFAGKESPIPYEEHDIRAFLDGTKSQTRQIVQANGEVIVPEQGLVPSCPYGGPGDRIWVQESGIASRSLGVTPSIAGVYRHDVPATPDCGEYWIQRTRSPGATYNVAGCSREGALQTRGARATAAADMPRWACRILLEIVSVRLQRLHDISEADAIAEGIGTFCVMTPFDSFQSLWKLNQGDESWNANPWVWAIEVSRVPNITIRTMQDGFSTRACSEEHWIAWANGVPGEAATQDEAIACARYNLAAGAEPDPVYRPR